MIRKKAVFPDECCGSCAYYKEHEKEFSCWALPPVSVQIEDGPAWIRGAFVEPEEPSCIYFKPRMHG